MCPNKTVRERNFMPRSKGKYLSQAEITNITRLLASTDLNLEAIGTRMSCTKGTIVAINRKYGIRSYNGRRSVWQVNIYPDGCKIPES
jgi:ribosomal protein S13